MDPHQDSGVERQEFNYRLDYHWQAIAFYTIALLLFALVEGTIANNTITLDLDNPIVILLFCFVVFAGLSITANWHSQRSIIIGENYITFRNRFREKTFNTAEISGISIGKEKIIKVRGAFKVAKITLHNRRRMLRIRPSLYENETQLIHSLTRLKRTLHSPALPSQRRSKRKKSN